MTEKRFKYTFKGIEDTLESDEECKYTLCNKDGFQDLCEMLNELNDENEQLKKEYLKLDHRHGLLHDECLDVECERDSLKKDVESLEKENEQLKIRFKEERDTAMKLGSECDSLTIKNQKLKQENEELKQVLGSILIEVKQQISTHKTGEIRAFINPNSFDLISDVLRRYGALKEWYDD